MKRKYIRKRPYQKHSPSLDEAIAIVLKDLQVHKVEGKRGTWLVSEPKAPFIFALVVEKKRDDCAVYEMVPNIFSGKNASKIKLAGRNLNRYEVWPVLQSLRTNASLLYDSYRRQQSCY